MGRAITWRQSEHEKLKPIAEGLKLKQFTCYAACKQGVALLPHRTWEAVRAQLNQYLKLGKFNGRYRQVSR